MEELYIEGLANHDDREPCVGAREGAGEASASTSLPAQHALTLRMLGGERCRSAVCGRSMHGAMRRALETEQSRQPNKAALGKPRDLSPVLTYHCHPASARPYRACKTGCDRSDSAGQAHPALQGLSSPVVVLQGERRDPLGRGHPPTDQKVGGSNPSERAENSQVWALSRGPSQRITGMWGR